MEDNLGQKLATAAKTIIDNTAATHLRNEETLKRVAAGDMSTQGYPWLGIKADFGLAQLYVKVRELETLTAPCGSVFNALSLEILISVTEDIMNCNKAHMLTETLREVSACAAKLEELLEGPTWMLKMSADEATAKRMQDRRIANETLACAILHTPEAKETLKHIKVCETRCVKHPSARLLERCELTWNVQLPGGRSYSVRGNVNDDSIWVTRNA